MVKQREGGGGCGEDGGDGLQRGNNRQKKRGEGKGGQRKGGTRERWKTQDEKGRGYVLHTTRRRRRTATIIALSYLCTVINSLLVGEPVPPAGAGPDDKPPPPGSAALAIYDQGTYTREPAGSLPGSASSLLGPGDNLKWGHSVTSHPPPPLPSILTAHHRLVTADSAVLSTYCRLDNKPPVTSAGNHFIFRTFAGLNQLQVRSTAVLE